MKRITKNLNWAMFAFLAALFLSATIASAQNCVGLPAVPTASTTATQDRDRMMCQQGLTFPILPVRMGTAWPWNDPTAPTNARPRDLATPEGNWTDAQGHTIVRTAWGNWHTYDSNPVFEPDPSLHFNPGSAVWPYPTLTGGALTGVGDYGPESNPRYPDINLLAMKDGTPVLSREDWWIKRRPEIFALVQDEFYGTNFPGFAPTITWTVGAVTTGNQTIGGVVYPWRQKTFTGVVSVSGFTPRNTPVITVTCRYPAAKVGIKTPVIIQNGGSATTVFGFTAAAGFGGCGYSNTMLQPDSGGQAMSSYLIGEFNSGNWRHPTDPGALVAWAWGVSRVIDRFATDPDTDEDKVGLEGHSRYGKATLVAAAYDDRIVAAFPSCGGSMGTSWARRHYGESLSFVSSSTSEYHWVNGKIMTYAGPITPSVNIPGKVQYLDVDVHSVMSLIAPRAVMTNGGTDTPTGNGDAWQDPRGMFLAGKYSAPVWEFLGWPGQIIPDGTVFTDVATTVPATCGTNSTSGKSFCDPSGESAGGTPPFDTPFISGTVGWRRHHEGHTDSPDWPTFVLMATRYFNDARPAIAAGQSFVLGDAPAGTLGFVTATDADTADTLSQWQVKGGTGAYKFSIDPATGQLVIVDPLAIDFVNAPTYTLTLMVGDGKLPSHDQTITISVPDKINVCHKGRKTINISRVDVPDHINHGDLIGQCSQ